jgi:hypothetical protein
LFKYHFHQNHIQNYHTIKLNQKSSSIDPPIFL